MTAPTLIEAAGTPCLFCKRAPNSDTCSRALRHLPSAATEPLSDDFLDQEELGLLIYQEDGHSTFKS